MGFFSFFRSARQTLSRDQLRGVSSAKIDWRRSEGHQRLLLNFIFPSSADSAAKWVDWTEVLGEPLEAAVDRLKADGALVQVDEPKWRIQHKRGAQELKKMCEENGLKTSGSKEQMAERLANVDGLVLRMGFAGEMLKCSAEAAEIAEARRSEWKRSQLDDSELKGVVTLKEFEAAKETLTKEFLSKGHASPSDDDVKWRLLNMRALQNAREGNLGLCRNVHFAMAKLLERQNKSKDALRFYFIVCAFDLNGARNGGGLSETSSPRHSAFDATDSFLAPAVVHRVKTIADELTLSSPELSKQYMESTSQRHFPLKWEKTWAVLALAMEGRIDLEDQPRCFQIIRTLLG